MSSLLLTYAALFAWSFLAATVLPLSSEVPLAALVRAQGQIAAPVLVATAGNYLGACTTYWLGRRAARGLGGGEGHVENSRAGRLLARYGGPALLLSWVPVLGDALVAGAGAVGVRFLGFSAWVVPGKGLRYLAVAWAAAEILS
ncbi:MAG: DedA family protein [Acidobacteria bacterium]|nr:DedA family protein [Acidobacteriota bacterium]MCA1619933.1 DedA family protein [Acidobacteriota bacterium]